MKKLLLFLLGFNTLYCHAQLANSEERRQDAELEKRLKKMPLNENQYFDTGNKNAIVLFNVISDKAIKNKDSLFHASRHIYDDILANTGKAMENETIDIGYWGKETDKNNISFSYSNSQYKGEPIYKYQKDTLLAPDSTVRKRLDRLSYNKYVRHEYDRSGLTIIFYVISKDANTLNQKLAETDAIKFLVKYVDAPYCSYNRMKIFYIDQYTASMNLYNVNVSDLIVNNLINYLTAQKTKP